MNAVLYVHGKGGAAAEAEHYVPLFHGCEVFGLDYKTFTPWETGKEINDAVKDLRKSYGKVTVVANSIGAYFSLHANLDGAADEAFFISPVVDMEKLITSMMRAAKVSEEELGEKGRITTDFGEDLSWEYLRYVRENPVRWSVPTHVLYGGKDGITSLSDIKAFAEKYGADLTVMGNGEHWFHEREQLSFLDEWIKRILSK